MLKNESILKELSPHPISFIKFHFLWIIPFLWGLFLLWFYDKLSIFGAVLWVAGLAIIGIVASILLIRWSIFIVYIAVIGIGLFFIWEYNMDYRIFIPLYTMLIFIFGAPVIEIFRRSHKYIITNFRIILRGGILRRKERSLRYEKITDISGEQGIFGKIFSFGNIIPITQSGFGLGSDEAFAGGGMQHKRFFGFFGGGKEVSTPRARSYYQLYGVYPYKEIKKLIEELIQESLSYEREQVELQRKIVDLLEKKNKEDNHEENL